MPENNSKAVINFDVDTKLCEKILGKNYRDIYNKIKRFLLKEGFSNLQGSMYVSKNNMSLYKAAKIYSLLIKKYPYIPYCVRSVKLSEMKVSAYLDRYNKYNGKTNGLEQIYNPEYNKDLKN
ncbi:MAG: hypothetical protein NC240_11085 [Clostridium sp.]|nr:hypothetical protein [Clostridium sp.]